MATLTQSDLDSLTTQERFALITQLWNSLDNEHLPLSAAQRDELDSRLATLDEDRKAGISWKNLKAEIESRCP